MADMNFGVNLLPVSNKSNSLGSSSKKWNDIYADKINGQSPTELNNSLLATQSGIAIIVSGDRASMAVPVGGYAYIKNNTHGLTEGLYKNTSSSAFPVSGGTANSTVFTAVSTGAINDAFASRFALVETTIVSGSKTMPYPDGFNQNNCTLISSWLYAYSGKFYNDDAVQVILQSSGVAFTKGASVSEESPVAAVLMKI